MRPALHLLAAAFLAAAILVPASAARPDGPLTEYLEHLQSELVLEWPADGALTDGFGPRWGRLHQGLDIGVLRSLGVRAASRGSVVSTGYVAGFAGYGNVVLVDVGGGYSTLYAHLSRVDVRPGDWVTPGQQLGLAGCTGSCTGTHLHFELRDRGTPVDPLPRLEAAR